MSDKPSDKPLGGRDLFRDFTALGCLFGATYTLILIFSPFEGGDAGLWLIFSIQAVVFFVLVKQGLQNAARFCQRAGRHLWRNLKEGRLLKRSTHG